MNDDPAMKRALDALAALAQAAIDRHQDTPAHELEPDTIDLAAAHVVMSQAQQTVALAEMGSSYQWPSVTFFSWWVSQALHVLEIFPISPPAGSQANVAFLLSILPAAVE